MEEGGSLVIEQRSFCDGPVATGESAETSVGARDAVTRNDDGPAVFGKSVTHRAARSGVPRTRSQFAVREDVAGRGATKGDERVRGERRQVFKRK